MIGQSDLLPMQVLVEDTQIKLLLLLRSSNLIKAVHCFLGVNKQFGFKEVLF